ncbi:MAG: amidinotransferase [Bacteroidales bacterium]|nr:amidinotransferase [Bacteroidales bacterium]
MVKPVRFGFNPQTAQSNAFQKKEGYGIQVQEAALREFLAYATLLRANGISIALAEDTQEPRTPDSIFPNNWFSTHEDGTLVLYPMAAPNRREERKGHFLEIIKKNFKVTRTVDLTHYEEEGLFLEGTGSMILDRENKIVYACRSPRTDMKVLDDFCTQLGYTPVTFESVDRNGQQIYHTNVMMCVGTAYAIVCLESIADPQERENVVTSLEKSGKKIIEITFDQVNKFAGNMLELRNGEGKKFLVMSATARKSLTSEQNRELSKTYRLLSPQLETIETNGGGSARCMLAEIF